MARLEAEIFWGHVATKEEIFPREEFRAVPLIAKDGEEECSEGCAIIIKPPQGIDIATSSSRM